MSYKINKTGEQIEEILNRADKALDGYISGTPDILTQAKTYTDSFGAEAIAEIELKEAEAIADIASAATSALSRIPDGYSILLMTQQQYDALPTKDSKTLYLITEV